MVFKTNENILNVLSNSNFQLTITRDTAKMHTHCFTCQGVYICVVD